MPPATIRLNDEKLVKLVQKYPSIYDPRHENYKDLPTRKKSWQIISDMLKEPVELCKTRWKNIRDSYCRRKRLSRKGYIRSGYMPKWHLSELLGFLDDINPPRPTNRSRKTNKTKEEVTSSSDDDADNDDDDNDDYDNEEKKSTDFMEISSIKPEYDDPLENTTEEQQQQPQLNIGNNSIIEQPHTQSSIRDNETVNLATTSNDTRDNCDDRQLLLTELLNGKFSYDGHPIDIFFKSMATAVKKLTEERQIRAKIEVCQVIAQLELEQLIAKTGKS